MIIYRSVNDIKYYVSYDQFLNDKDHWCSLNNTQQVRIDYILVDNDEENKLYYMTVNVQQVQDDNSRQYLLNASCVQLWNALNQLDAASINNEVIDVLRLADDYDDVDIENNIQLKKIYENLCRDYKNVINIEWLDLMMCDNSINLDDAKPENMLEIFKAIQSSLTYISIYHRSISPAIYRS